MDLNQKNTLIALGTGTSTGIPMMGCKCPVCSSLDHRDKRLRTSIFIESKHGNKILVDTTPDLRSQFLENKISGVDFVIITHEHSDHVHGIDDLRPLTFGPPVREIPVYCNSETGKILEQRFAYIFNPTRPAIGGGIPRLRLHEVNLLKETKIFDEKFIFFNYPHGHGETMGFLFQKMAYVVDCQEIPEKIVSLLTETKLDLLIIDCLKRGSHSTHLSVERAFNYIKQIKPIRTGLIHMSHDLSHTQLEAMASNEFGSKVFPLYDQQKIFF